MLLVAAVSVSIIFFAWPSIMCRKLKGLNLIVESGTRCLQLIVCLVEPYAAGHFCQYKI